ncbi:MAG: dsDNA nuclease domain-containing protein, partial [Clostridiaceae bacterium]|nr:dsDNA nuclease domain-containing protein [Clostridiaceae bacterium]
MDLRETIIKQKPRDNSGSRSANRFEYQKNWALCKLLELYLTRKDYLLIFEYHDDIIILDSEVNPQKVEFYQVKTKDHSEWTLNDLISSSKAKRKIIPSILSKMYINKLNFPSSTQSLNLVSNQKYNIKLKKSKGLSNNKNRICILDV